MSSSTTRARAALAPLSAGAMVGAFERVVTDSFGATPEALVLPWCAWFLALALVRGVPARLSARLSNDAFRWATIGITTALILASPRLTDALASGVGALALPRVVLPVLWVLMGTLAALAPARAFPATGHFRGIGFGLGVFAGALAPGPLAALVVGGLAAGAPPAAQPTGSVHDGWLERGISAGGVAFATALGVHALLILQPPLDPTPLMWLVAGATAAFVVPIAPLARGAWVGWLLVGTACVAAAVALPHTVGLGRLIHTTITPWVALQHSPSLGPALVGAGVGVVLGVVGTATASRSSTGPERPLAAAAGLVLGLSVVNPAGMLPIYMAGLVTTLALLLAGSRPVQGGGLVLGGLLAAAIWRGTALPVDVLVLSPVPGLRNTEAWTTHLDRAVDLVPGQTHLGGGTVGTVLAAPEDWRATGATSDALPFETDLAGRVGRPVGRAAEAEVMGGLLAGLLAPRLDRVLVLGDDVGNALTGLSNAAPTAVDIATPAPGVIQDIARLAPLRRDRWLAPGTRLWPEHPATVLRRAPAPAAIVDIAHAPWLDGAHAPPTPAHIATARRTLGDFGVYVLVVHLDAWSPGQPAALAATVAQEFGHLQVWLPPTGADSMILVASGRALSLARAEERVEPMLPTMRNLGFPNITALASMAVGDARSAEAWQTDTPTAPRWLLGSAVRGPLSLHLAAFAPHVATVDRIWDLDGASTGAPALASRLDTRQRFLELLGDAARGDVASALDKARGLSDDEGGERALRALVGPHLDNARKALAIAIKEGPSSGAWADVHRFATTARMIAPTSPEPLVILGSMSLAQGDLKGAHAHFSEAEQLADGDLDALTGLAWVARQRRDKVSAERYFQEAVTANPREWIAWHRLGVFLLESGRHDDAKEKLKRALDYARGASSAPHLALARLYLETDSPTNALVHAESAIVMGENAEAYFVRGLAHMRLDQLDNAERDFRQAVLLDPTFAAAHGEIGRIRAVKGDVAAAEQAWNAVLRIDPNNVAARDNLRRLGIEERAAASGPPD